MSPFTVFNKQSIAPFSRGFSGFCERVINMGNDAVTEEVPCYGASPAPLSWGLAREDFTPIFVIADGTEFDDEEEEGDEETPVVDNSQAITCSKAFPIPAPKVNAVSKEFSFGGFDDIFSDCADLPAVNSERDATPVVDVIDKLTARFPLSNIQRSLKTVLGGLTNPPKPTVPALSVPTPVNHDRGVPQGQVLYETPLPLFKARTTYATPSRQSSSPAPAPAMASSLDADKENVFYETPRQTSSPVPSPASLSLPGPRPHTGDGSHLQIEALHPLLPRPARSTSASGQRFRNARSIPLLQRVLKKNAHAALASGAPFLPRPQPPLPTLQSQPHLLVGRSTSPSPLALPLSTQPPRSPSLRWPTARPLYATSVARPSWNTLFPGLSASPSPQPPRLFKTSPSLPQSSSPPRPQARGAHKPTRLSAKENALYHVPALYVSH
ncbi:hypothetical protein PUNSTDRAFT_146479 [Punctularia strigosozonata HHB-11173 SS5]|uniref:Uncharacterized protein n=1 Tax=Punctularia strigosozonata (strain HHB-11173) TaxID=741275 RepID=R7S594_PUNST|nr:uncharacterized protein PUNSTDRAFT_146479 [Punctularia strigosozonata HHB-11173 SS5]EIN04526.1 hypothetical protein PUNSTDRAFT_146479 [Punctularia strigosozonata HHB-11173 SS5]